MSHENEAPPTWIVKAIDTASYQKIAQVTVVAKDADQAHEIGRRKLRMRIGRWGFTCTVDPVSEGEEEYEPHHLRHRSLRIDGFHQE